MSDQEISDEGKGLMIKKRHRQGGWRCPSALILGLLAVIWFLTACGSNTGSVAAISGGSPDQQVDGKTLYEAHCASCHGINGEGQPNWQVPSADGVFPAPPHDSEGHTWHHPDQLLLEITANGGSLPNSAMPGFADKLTQEQMAATVDYIKTFWEPDQRAIQADITQRYQSQ